jgi:hypothetical protein
MLEAAIKYTDGRKVMPYDPDRVIQMLSEAFDIEVKAKIEFTINKEDKKLLEPFKYVNLKGMDTLLKAAAVMEYLATKKVPLFADDNFINKEKKDVAFYLI